MEIRLEGLTVLQDVIQVLAYNIRLELILILR